VTVGGALLLLLVTLSSIADAQIPGVTAHAWPNERYSSHQPPDAVDGDLITFTWTTEEWNTLPSHLGLDLGAPVPVYRIRLWKDPDAGIDPPGTLMLPKDLVILVTTDTGAMSGRTWASVTGLTNGYLGTELMTADAVLSEGIVLGEFHDSVYAGEGWASLTFDLTTATGVAIGFDKTPETTFEYIHYKVYEFEVYGAMTAIADGEVTWGTIKSLYSGD